jgi:PTS system mannose-specific IIA component
VVPDQNIDAVNQLGREAVRRLNDGSGVLVITDVMGGTPSNCCRSLGEPHDVSVIAGISLPMLLRAVTYRQDTLDVVVEMALAGGQNGATRVDSRVRIAPN